MSRRGTGPTRRPSELRRAAEAIFRAGVAAVDPEGALRRVVRRRGGRLLVGDLSLALDRLEHIYVVGAGKAGVAMTRALIGVLGDRISGGVVNVPATGHSSRDRLMARIRLVSAGHPIPDAAGLTGAEAMIRLLQQARPHDLVLCVISGGGSALLPAPVPGVTLQEKQALTRLLLRSGATIQEINALRKHLSRLKGGGLIRLAAPARVIALILSDVVGDPLDAIASGPTAPDPTTFADCLAILRRYGLTRRVPRAVLRCLRSGAAGRLPETVKPADPLLARGRNLLVGTNAMALRAAAAQARQLGFRPLILSSSVEGEAREVARVQAAILREVRRRGLPIRPPACLLAGGETTVTVRGHGRGGRNQELALAAAPALDGLRGVGLLCAGTDGVDGPTEAAGAWVDGTTIARARALGLDPRGCLEDNDAYSFFRRLGDLLVTGPTGTNVMDLMLMLAV